MYSEMFKGWLKHLDFMILDAVCLEISLLITYFARHGYEAAVPELYRDAMWVVLILHICGVFFLSSYRDIIRRGYLVELKRATAHCTFISVGMIIWMFMIQRSGAYSRITVLTMYPVSVFLCWGARLVWKRMLRKQRKNRTEYRKLLIIAGPQSAEEAAENLQQPYREYMFAGMIVYDEEYPVGGSIYQIPVVANKQTMMKYIQENIIDEVFLSLDGDYRRMEKLTELFVNMGITVHTNLLTGDYHMEERRIHSLGNYVVMTSSMKFAEPWQVCLKRILDICGALVGLILAGLAILIFGPVIKKQSPGPVLFSQERVGRNGRVFRIWKLRTMYPDAEERKKELLKENKMDDYMFKIDNDPRIIPVGRFLREKSIDELPQFWNVLKGEMSLVGTRPPTTDEYEKYKLGHRKRLAMKPGLTGLWQVSGRSNITDFDEIVALDAKYIEQWDISMDIKILWKTIGVVFTGNGAV